VSVRIISSRVDLVDKKGMIKPDWFTFFSDWVAQFNKRELTGSATATAVTGSTTATEALSASVVTGVTGSLRMTINTTTTNNANAKTIIVKAGGVVIQTATVTNSTAFQSISFLLSGRAANSQYCSVTSAINCTGTAGAVAVDMSGSVTISVELQLGNAADTITLQSYFIDLGVA